MFQGTITALLTPFRNGVVDEQAYQAFVEWQISQGIHGVVPVGTTGESPTLIHHEHKRVVELCIEVAKDRIPVIAGTGSNSTEEAIDLTMHAKAAGADAALVVTPYYNKPTQEGLYQHYVRIAGSADIPIIIYNIPGRSVVDMEMDTMARLSKVDNIVGVKDATNDLARPVLTRLCTGSNFCQLSGEDATVAAFLAQGGDGCISVTSNVAPRQCVELYDAWRAGDMEIFAKLRDQLAPLHRALFCESSPGPVKYAASLLDKCLPEVRLPLVEISESSKLEVCQAMKSAGLLN